MADLESVGRRFESCITDHLGVILNNKKLLVYGDSYAQKIYPYAPDYKSWSQVLADKLGLELINNAIGGSSIEYSIKCFIRDKISNVISPNDIIIFIITSMGRLHLKYQNDNPGTASSFKYEKFTSNYPVEHINFYKKNKNFIKWYISNKDEVMDNINTSAYIHMLNSYARSNPDNTILVFSMNNIIHPVEVPSLSNFILPNINLFTISNNEFCKDIDFSSWVRLIVSDPRPNHFCIPNSDIFANLAYEAICNKDPSIFTYDKFLQNILDKNIESKKDIFYFMDKKLIPSGYKFLLNFK